MPTQNPRVNVTLSPSLDLLVSRLARHQNQSKSQVLRELLEAAEPALQRAVSLMDAASKASAEVRTGLARSMERAQDSVEDALAVVLHRLDAGADLLTAAEAVKGRKPAVRRASEARTEQPASAAVEVSDGGVTPSALTGGSGRKTRGAARRVSSPKRGV